MFLKGQLASIWIIACAGAVLGILPVMVLGLAVPGTVTVPMAMALGGLFAGLAASWSGNRFVTDGSRSRILAVVGVTEAVALTSAALLLAVVLVTVLLPLIVLVFVLAVVMSYSAARATLHLRTTAGRAGMDTLLSALLLLVGLLTVTGGIPLLCSTVVSCHA